MNPRLLSVCIGAIAASTALAAEADKRFSWDVKTPANGNYQEFIMSEGRYKLLTKANPAHAAELFAQAEKDAAKRMEFIQNVGKIM